MSEVLHVGGTPIAHAVRFSPKAARKRIVVTETGVKEVAPHGTPLDEKDGVYAFVHAKRRWVFDGAPRRRSATGRR